MIPVPIVEHTNIGGAYGPMECPEQKRLHEELSQALRVLVELQGSQIAAVKLGDKRTTRFEEEIRTALNAWQSARRAYLQHCAEHGC
jgi:hypothetical protein